MAWDTVEGSSNNYWEPKVWGNYLRVPRRYIRPQSPQNAVLFRFYHGLYILWVNKVRISPNAFDNQIRSIGRRRRKLNSIYSLGRILDDIPRQTENETWHFHSWLYYCIPCTKYVRGILWFSRRYAAASASADTSSFSR